MILLYENEWGRLTLSKEFGLHVKEISGLGLPKQENSVISYVNQPGQIFVSTRDAARVITISFDVLSGSEGLRRLLKTMSHSGKMIIFSDGQARSIFCRCTMVDEPIKRGPFIRSVVLQFTCDHPYFTDRFPVVETIFSREDVICDHFMLPCLFSKRVNRRLIQNWGDLKAEPVFTICNQLKAEAELQEGDGIELINHTTGQRILLACSTDLGEVITIDIPKRSVTSSRKGNLATILSKNSFLSDFWLVPGVNDLEVVNHNTGEAVDVTLSFDNQYLEAVI